MTNYVDAVGIERPVAHLPAIHQETVTLTDEQIKALPALGVEVISAPGPNKLIIPLSAVCVLNAAAGAYTADAGSSWLLQWATNTYACSPTPVQIRLQSASVTFIQINASPVLKSGIAGFSNLTVGDNSLIPISQVTDQALQIKDDWNGVSNYTGGHQANTLIVSVAYMILNLQSGVYE